MAEMLRTGAAVVGLLLIAAGGAQLSVPVTMISVGALLLAAGVYGTLRKLG